MRCFKRNILVRVEWKIKISQFKEVVLISSSSYHMLNAVFSPSTELARFRLVIVFTIPRHFVRSHASSFSSPFFFISFSTCFFHVCFGLPLPLLPLTSNFKAFTITFSSFLKLFSMIYGFKYHMKYFHHNFEFLHPLVVLQFDWTSLK